eukprot:CAMPEP_0175047186 /NCGR_PEP_ID=MMETSP0052_2-20121109/5448_1 /TAXON_ID=51329 ORGANISM="Polytomella parva, Strain SAG 63-3" /NCGR_SAMPLE_ID=MMETSP0052_2 /ASSEMBLY_ACC=CAM_ASM_000194 /LENGTH=475 /DNA_ID=CAMNT_0016311019 /DNA_START=109 /DNA_END=1533 /DNA_ORIENTATION=-
MSYAIPFKLKKPLQSIKLKEDNTTVEKLEYEMVNYLDTSYMEIMGQSSKPKAESEDLKPTEVLSNLGSVKGNLDVLIDLITNVEHDCIIGRDCSSRRLNINAERTDNLLARASDINKSLSLASQRLKAAVGNLRDYSSGEERFYSELRKLQRFWKIKINIQDSKCPFLIDMSDNQSGSSLPFSSAPSSVAEGASTISDSSTSSTAGVNFAANTYYLPEAAVMELHCGGGGGVESGLGLGGGGVSFSSLVHSGRFGGTLKSSLISNNSSVKISYPLLPFSDARSHHSRGFLDRGGGRHLGVDRATLLSDSSSTSTSISDSRDSNMSRIASSSASPASSAFPPASSAFPPASHNPNDPPLPSSSHALCAASHLTKSAAATATSMAEISWKAGPLALSKIVPLLKSASGELLVQVATMAESETDGLPMERERGRRVAAAGGPLVRIYTGATEIHQFLSALHREILWQHQTGHMAVGAK